MAVVPVAAGAAPVVTSSGVVTAATLVTNPLVIVGASGVVVLGGAGEGGEAQLEGTDERQRGRVVVDADVGVERVDHVAGGGESVDHQPVHGSPAAVAQRQSGDEVTRQKRPLSRWRVDQSFDVTARCLQESVGPLGRQSIRPHPEGATGEHRDRLGVLLDAVQIRGDAVLGIDHLAGCRVERRDEGSVRRREHPNGRGARGRRCVGQARRSVGRGGRAAG